MQFRVIVAGLAVLALAACGSAGTPETPSDGGSGTSDAAKTLTVISHDSFNIPEELKAEFAKESGLEVIYTPLQDAGSMVNQLVLTKDSPLGDVVFGIDNTFASRAEKEGIVDPYIAADLDARGKEMATEQMTPIDFGDVCVNADKVWFEQQGKQIPKTLDDLTNPEYKDLFVAPSPATSSPGLAFLLTTVGAKGEDGWLDYMKALQANGTSFVSGWTEAYNSEFTAGEGKGNRPLVLSYATSPAWTIGDDGESTTVNLPETCFRQIEYAAVLKGAKNPEGARKFIDFLLSKKVQESIPENMYMYPVLESAELPEEWVKFAPLSDNPFEVDAATIDANREQWIQEWSEYIG